LFDQMAATHGAAWFAISVDVHSCTLSPEVWRDIEVRPFILHPWLHSPLPALEAGEECRLMGRIETSPKCIFITFDGHQWPLAGSCCADPCMCAHSDSCRVRLP
jgi:hypothetical protein